MPAPVGVGVRPDGTLGWVDANGNEVNPDGSPMPGTPTQLRPATPAANTVGASTQPTLQQGATTQQQTAYPPPVTIPPATPTTPATTTPPAAAAPGTPGATSIGAPQAQGPNQSGTAGQYTVEQILAPFDTEYQAAQQAVTDANDRINGRHGQKDAQGNPLPDITGSGEGNNAVVNPSAYAADVTALSAAEQRLEVANTNRANALQTAIQKQEITPSQVQVAQSQAASYQATADKTQEELKILSDPEAIQDQKDLVAGQAAQDVNNAKYLQAQADARTAETAGRGPEAAQLQAQADWYKAQSDNLSALTQSQKNKLDAETGLTLHQQGLTDSQSSYYTSLGKQADAQSGLIQANADYQRQLVPGAAAYQAAQTAAQAGAGAESQANAQAALEKIKQAQLGPAYGLQQQLDALGPIVQSVFHNPANIGKSPDELNSMADDLLKQYTVAAMGGTSVAQAAAATATAQQNNYATQMGGVNALQAAMANRANAYAGAEGNIFGTLAQMNQWAPRGNSMMGPAFQAMMDQLGNKMNTQFGPTAIPQAPPLPTFLQAFAAGHQAGQAQATGAGAGSSAPTISINVNGQPASGAGAINPGGLPIGGPAPPGANPTQAFNQGVNASGFNPAAVPSFANNYMAFANPMNMIGGIGIGARAPVGGP